MRTKLMSLLQLRESMLANPPAVSGLPWWAQGEVLKDRKEKLDQLNTAIEKELTWLRTSEEERIELSLKS